MWVTETAESAAGGNPWVATFVDSFRYLYQLGSLARRGVKVIAHNTLAASDYGLLGEDTFTPRPNYWAALLWRTLMGTQVLDPGPSPAPSFYRFAHSLREEPDGTAVLLLNTDRRAAHAVKLSRDAARYTLSASHLFATSVALNGRELRLGADDELPPLEARAQRAGMLVLKPATITFLAVPG